MPKLKKTKDPVRDYADNVVSGAIMASRWVRLAGERHRRDLDREDLFWDLEAALFAIGFFQDVLRLNGGQFEGMPFVLEPPQEFIVGSIFGWKLLDGRRRFNTAYIEMGKGSGKSPLAAGIGHLGLVADGEMRAEIYAAATKRDQAMVLFRDAVAMVDQSPDLRQLLKKSGIGEKCWNLAYHDTGSFFKAISSDEDSQSGPRPHFALVDEVHEHKTGIVIEMLSAGFKSRRNPLMFMITNSGSDRETVCWRYHDLVTRVLKQTAVEDRLFGFIACLDPCDTHWNQGQEQPVGNCADCDDWRIEGRHWQKANPLLGRTMAGPPGIEYIRAQVSKAKNLPAEENMVRRLNFGCWTQQTDRWLSIEAWDACDKPIDYEALRNRPCILGLDLAVKRDLAAVVALFPPDRMAIQTVRPAAETTAEPQPVAFYDVEEEPAVKYSKVDVAATDDFVVIPYFFMPKDNILKAERDDKVNYSKWVKEGLITATEGPIIDYRAIKMKIAEINGLFPIRSEIQNGVVYHLAGFDPWNATDFVNDMRLFYSINMIEVRQGFQTMNEPTKQMAELVTAKKLRHGGNPVLRWMADNMVVRKDPAGNVKPDKDKARNKIDGIVAMIIAFSLSIRYAGAGINVYEQRYRAGGDESIVRTT